jgi:hypothetical protein
MRQHRAAVTCGRRHLRRHQSPRRNVAAARRLPHAGAALGEAEVREARRERRRVQRLAWHALRRGVGHAGLQIGRTSRTDSEVAYLAEKGHATLRLDLSVPFDRSCGEGGPRGVRIRHPCDATLIIVSAKGGSGGPSRLRLLRRPDESYTGAALGGMPCGGRAHQAAPNDRKVVERRKAAVGRGHPLIHGQRVDFCLGGVRKHVVRRQQQQECAGTWPIQPLRVYVGS